MTVIRDLTMSTYEPHEGKCESVACINRRSRTLHQGVLSTNRPEVMDNGNIHRTLSTLQTPSICTPHWAIMPATCPKTGHGRPQLDTHSTVINNGTFNAYQCDRKKSDALVDGRGQRWTVPHVWNTCTITQPDWWWFACPLPQPGRSIDSFREKKRQNYAK